MKELRHSSPIILQKSVLTSCQVVKQNLPLFFLFFVSIRVFFHEYSRFMGQSGKREAISLHPFYHSHSLHRDLDISWVIAVECSPLREQPKTCFVLLE